MSSEADLDADIKALSILSSHPELYSDFAQLGCVASLVSLLSHENTDIAIDAVEVIGELIDEDVEADEDQWNALVDAMVKTPLPYNLMVADIPKLDSDLLNLLYQNIARLNEESVTDRSGVYHVLSMAATSPHPMAIANLAQALSSHSPLGFPSLISSADTIRSFHGSCPAAPRKSPS